MRTVTRMPPRGGATGASRWHPYHAPKSTGTVSAQTCTSPSSPIITSRCYLNTPVSSLVLASDTFRNPSNKQTKNFQSPSAHHYLSHKERQDAKKAQKEKFENALKELAVQRIADIWKETSYVIHSGGGSTPVDSMHEKRSPSASIKGQPAIYQLPSPSTPSTQTFTSPPSNTVRFNSQSTTVYPPRRIPLRAFVHEVLRRSKTMWPALQVALCYLDAAKCKVPTAIAEARQGGGLQAAEAALDSLFGSASASSISEAARAVPRPPQQPLTPESHASSPGLSNNDSTSTRQVFSDEATATENKSTNIPHAPAVAPVDAQARGAGIARRRRTPPVPAEPLPPRPSPLLCPRRMFVAALILATKFTQDRVYSNRAWARISGLEAREVSRCERALGEALEWRLWVGKGIADEPTAFLRNFLLAEESLAAKSKSPVLARAMSDSAILQDSHTTRDLSSALKRSSSLNSVDLFSTNNISTPMLNDPSTLVLTPANADLDAMNVEPTPSLHHSVCPSTISSYTMDSTPTSLTSNEFSFTPATRNGMLTPPFSQYSPTLLPLDFSVKPNAMPFSKLASWSGQCPDPIMRYPLGVEGTFDIIEGIDRQV